MMKPKELFKQIAIGGYVDYNQLPKEQLISELDRIATLLDDFTLHNHNLIDKADQGWFMLRNLLNAVADSLENK